MNIWTSFFLVISAVILAYPFLTTDGRSPGESPGRSRDTASGTSPGPVMGHWSEEEIRLDIDAGRLDPDILEPGTVPTSRATVTVADEIYGGVSESDEEDDGNLPERSTAQ